MSGQKISKQTLATISRILYVIALCLPVYELGDTAVFGHSYLWGESSIRVNIGQDVVYFVDKLEVAQHGAVAISFIFIVVSSLLKRVRLAAISMVVVTRFLVELRSFEVGYNDVVYMGFVGTDPLLILCILLLIVSSRVAESDKVP